MNANGQDVDPYSTLIHIPGSFWVCDAESFWGSRVSLFSARQLG